MAAFPGGRDVLVKGVIAAKEESKRCGFKDLNVVFSAVPSLNPADDF
jgi:hypothetical protein